MVITDTLVTDMRGTPSQYTTKCRLLPHMNMAIAGTGSGNLLAAWGAFLSESMMSLDIDMCATHTQRPLIQLWENICNEHGIEPLVGEPGLDDPAANTGRTATIYHFGQAPDGQYIWYVFRSTAGFEPERWDQGGFAIKPQPIGGFDKNTTAPETVDEMVSLGLKIRAEQDQRSPSERIFIGGELWLTSLQPNIFGQTCVHRFDNWQDNWNEMNEQLG